jgi:Domain of unknown function DUF11
MEGRLVPGIVVRAALVTALVLGALGGAAASATAGSECVAPGDGPQICLEVERTPESPVASTAAAPTYTSFSVTVANRDRSTATHVALEVRPIVTDLAEGFELFSATPSAGTCSYSAASSSLTCSVGSLARGAEFALDLALKTPSAPGPAALEFTASFDEGPSDNPGSGGKVDTVSLTDVTPVRAPGGATATSFVPEGADLQLGVTQGGQQGGVTLPAQDFSTTASLEFTGTNEIPFACPSVCRGGAWFSATIPGAFDPPAEFDLFWPANLVPRKQTERNFVVFYVSSPGADVETISARCDAARSVIPCIDDVTFFKKGPLKGGVAASIVRVDNGHMR